MMNSELESGVKKNEYNLVSVEKIDTPKDLPVGIWHRYVIARGNSTMEGMHSGSLSEVREYAEDFVEGLNERSVKGRSTYATRKKK